MPKGVYPRQVKPFAERFWAKVEKTDSCWLWQGTPADSDHGQIMNGDYKPAEPWKRRFMAHRVAYEMFFGPIPAGMCVCHKCDVPKCVNPEHLFLGTISDNNSDKVAKGRQPHGVACYNAILTPEQVMEVRSSHLSQRQLAEALGVSKTCIQAIRSGRSWALLPAQDGETLGV